MPAGAECEAIQENKRRTRMIFANAERTEWLREALAVSLNISMTECLTLRRQATTSSTRVRTKYYLLLHAEEELGLLS